MLNTCCGQWLHILSICLINIPSQLVINGCNSFQMFLFVTTGGGSTEHIQSNDSVEDFKKVGCATWPMLTSIQELKFHLGNEPFANFALDCNITEAKRVSTNYRA